MTNDKKIIAVFDFDGTITKRDTFIDFILENCVFGDLFWGGLRSLPILAFYILDFISPDVAKEKIFSYFFGKIVESEFKRICENYSLSRLPKIVRKQALQKIQWHKEQGHELVIVSASIETWIKPWAGKNGFDKVIATIPKVKNGLLTGEFQTKNCNREEKRIRFLAEYPDRSSYFLYVYGDSHKDDWLFEIADQRFKNDFQVGKFLNSMSKK